MPELSLSRFNDLPLQARHRVDRLCTRFESAWRAGDVPELGAYLEEVAAEHRPALFAELLPLEVEYRRHRGDVPRAEDYAGRFPGLSPVAGEVFAALPPADTPPATVHVSPRRPPSRGLPDVAGYEVLAELGRGGMGVVFKARQLPLRRLVALKMILAGDLASPDHRARFLVEGEILARLHHPNVVQVYEVGHHEGRPFLALEYVEGGTLHERLRQGPLAPRAAAALVEQLARAAHHAHLQGVVHRDLKPANVLLACEPGAAGPGGQAAPAAGEPPPGPDGSGLAGLVPKITDFGLGRWADHSACLTDTGMVLGTPSYMAPEQARGDRHVGPAADVYALGAILYEALTGAPPFRAPTPVETVRQVLDQEPRRPRLCRPGVPRDLETVCLKCLEKDPARRYASALALADDLRRWLDGEPITARPAGPAERAWKWCRRRPGLAGSLAALGGSLVAVAVISSVAALQLFAERQRTRQAEEQHKVAVVNALLTAAPDSVPYMLDTLAPSKDLAVPLLRKRFEEGAAGPGVRLRAAIGLTALGEPQTDFLLAAVPGAPAAESHNLALAFAAVPGPEVAGELRRRAARPANLGHRVRYAILLLDLGDDRAARALLAGSADPAPRGALIDAFPSWHGNLAALPGLLRRGRDGDCRSGLCAALGRVDPATLSAEVREALAAALTELYREAPDGGTHSAAGWALRQWRLPPPPLRPSAQAPPGRQWFVNRAGLTMLGLPPGTVHPRGARPVALTRPYFMSDREVTVAQFRALLADRDYPARAKPADWPGPVPEVTPREDCPVNNVALPDMVLFCNWLSVREGRRPCYSGSGGGVWRCDWDAGGYRLPTEAEWDHAHQAGARTTYFFGEDAEWFPQYAQISATRTAPAGSKLPNRWGLFDMVGNVWEPCWSYQAAPSRPALPDPDPARPLDPRVWMCRGAAYDSGTFSCQPGVRVPAGGRGGSLGFRVVCGPAAEGTPAGRDARGPQGRRGR